MGVRTVDESPSILVRYLSSSGMICASVTATHCIEPARLQRHGRANALRFLERHVDNVRLGKLGSRCWLLSSASCNIALLASSRQLDLLGERLDGGKYRRVALGLRLVLEEHGKVEAAQHFRHCFEQVALNVALDEWVDRLHSRMMTFFGMRWRSLSSQLR